MINLKYHIKTALGYFVLAAVLGVVLRSFHSVEIPMNYRYVVHAHSHIALLGWVYMALTTMVYKLYLEKQGLDKKYRVIFWFTQITLVGMLLTFPFQGYALFSIIFSTLFLFASYWFTWFFIRNTPNVLKKANSYKCIKMALWYMVLSSIGPWALGAIMATLGTGSIWYRLAIYFYLHFQYNGWMVLALAGLLFYVFEKNSIHFSKKSFKSFFRSINLGIILTFFLSVLWTEPPIIFNVLGGIGSIFQIIAFGILIKVYFKLRDKSKLIFSPLQIGMLKVIVILLGVKMLLQLATAFPYFANLATTYMDFTIGYLHWTFLGVISIGLFFFFDFFKLMRIGKLGYYLYLLGFICTETLIFYKGTMAWQKLPLFGTYFNVLAFVSCLIPIALFMLLWNNFRLRK